MKQEDKELLFKDLCARLPYHVRVKVWLKIGTTEEGFLDLEHNYADVLQDAFYHNEIKEIKPYLRPMSSMTEEENKRYDDILTKMYYHEKSTLGDISDYLNSIHVDYRGLIPKGLAIEVNESNNPYKK